jgi:opacity protein-like surface antigen
MRLNFAYPILAFGCLALSAGEPARLGLEGFVSNPAGSLRTTHGTTAGLGLGLFLDKALGEGHGLRWDISSTAVFPGATHTYVQTSDPEYTRETRTARLTSVGTNLSYTYHFDGGQTGPYVLAGLGMREMARSSRILPFVEPSQPKPGLTTSADLVSRTGTKLSYRLGAGYDFTESLGANVRFQGLTSQGRTLATVEAGVTYRF